MLVNSSITKPKNKEELSLALIFAKANIWTLFKSVFNIILE